MMTRKLPPLAAVRAFEAAARKSSIKDAAEELCLTASAVSHQIRALENYLDTALFTRSGNRVELTLTGRAYPPLPDGPQAHIRIRRSHPWQTKRISN